MPSDLVACVAALEKPFDQWLTDNAVEVSFAQLREPLLAGVAIMYEVGGATLTAWRPDTLSVMLDLFEAELPPEELQTLVATLTLTIGFLLSTERWRGPMGDADECLQLLEERDSDDGFEQMLIDVAENPVPVEEELAGLAGLPKVAAAVQVLTWIGARRPVTPAGNITLKDLPDAAAALGLSVRVTKSPPAPDQGAFELGVDLATLDPSARLVRGMSEVPALAAAWNLLQAGGLAERNGTRITPTQRGRAALSDEVAARAEAYRALAIIALQESFAGMIRNPQLRMVLSLHVSLLGAACRETPVSHEQWDATITHALDLMYSSTEIAFDEGDDDDVDHGPAETGGIGQLFRPFVDQRVDELRQSGYLTQAPDGYTVPRPLRSVVAQTLLAILEYGDELESDTFEVY